MPFEKSISPEELSEFGLVQNINEQAKTLVAQQKTTWELAGNNYKTLNNIKSRTFDFEDFKILTQFNAERIRSSAAKTDAKSIAERPCFLCVGNLPELQKGILFQNKYLILINPFPIFQLHLTISNLNHIPQLILPHFSDMLDLSRNLSDFTIFYNGPKCGASAPDHFHFQAVEKKSLPVENEFELLEEKHSELIFQNKEIKIVAVENYLRRFVAIISTHKSEIQKNFEIIYKNLVFEGDEEPMLNILCSFNDGEWRVIMFPREKQRPSHYFRTNEKKLVVSPAAVELGGVVVLPREEDFLKITKRELEEIYGEVSINKIEFGNLVTHLSNDLK